MSFRSVLLRTNPRSITITAFFAPGSDGSDEGLCLLAGVGEAVKSTGDEVAALKSRVATLARQLVMQQLFVEERARSDGDSGIKQVR